MEFRVDILMIKISVDHATQIEGKSEIISRNHSSKKKQKNMFMQGEFAL